MSKIPDKTIIAALQDSIENAHYTFEGQIKWYNQEGELLHSSTIGDPDTKRPKGNSLTVEYTGEFELDICN